MKYYKNHVYTYASRLPSFGGRYGYSASAGAFCLIVNRVAHSCTSIGCRLVFL